MRRFFILAGSLVLVLGLGTGLASAQFGEVIKYQIDSGPQDFPSIFGCTDGTECLAYARIYADLDPRLLNQSSPADPVINGDGYPNYVTKRGRWVGDAFNTLNYPGVNGTAQRCEAWYATWTGASNAGGADYQSFYSAQSTIINSGEVGQPNQPNCESATLVSGACMGEVRVDANGATAGSYPNAPFGAVNQSAAGAGWDPVPIPEFGNTEPDTSIANVSWPGAGMSNAANIASGSGATCPGGSSFDDLLGNAAGTPSPVWGVRLFAYVTSPSTPAGAGDFRSLLDLEGASATGVGGIDVLTNAGNGGLSCRGDGVDMNCPGVFHIPCAATTGGSCNISEVDPDGTVFSDFTAGAQSFQLSQAAVDTAVGGLAGGNGVVLLTKVVFRGALRGSTIKTGADDLPEGTCPAGTCIDGPDDGSACTTGNNNSCANGDGIPDNINGALVSLFSSNSTQLSFSGLISGVSLEARAGRGPFVELVVTTTGDVLAIDLFRSENGIDFDSIGSVDLVPGQNEYTINDRVRGRGQATVTYKAEYRTTSAADVVVQTFTTFDGNPGKGRGR